MARTPRTDPLTHIVLSGMAIIAATVLAGLGRVTGDTAVTVILAATGMGGSHALARAALPGGRPVRDAATPATADQGV